jgi:uncharacterized protein
MREVVERPRKAHQRLIKEDRSVFELDKGMSTVNFGDVSAELVRREKALEAAGQTAEASRRQANQNQDCHPNLADSYAGLSLYHSDLGRLEGALYAIQ